MSEVWAMVAAERSELADLCATLVPEQWDAPSLCRGWRVRDVVGHLVFTIETGPVKGAAKVVRGGLRVDEVLRREAVALGNGPTDELVRRLRAGAHQRRPGDAAHALVDALVHHQDIRRPLGLDRIVPEERVRLALDTYKDVHRSVARRRRLVGLRLEATDMHWSHGDGLLVWGTGEQLLMVMAGRMAVVGELSGPGKGPLAGRS